MDIEEQYDKIYRYCYFRLRDTQLAQDITQETFLRFYRQDLKLDKSKELPYLYTIAGNLCVDEFRRRRVRSIEDIRIKDIGINGIGMKDIGMKDVGINDVGMEAAVCDKSEELIDSLTVRAAMEKLPQEEQELLFLRYVNEIPIASICKIKGISRFAVYRRLSNALKRLKEELIKEGFSE